MSARDDILERVRAANAHTAHPSIERAYQRAGVATLPPSELLDLLEDRLLDYRATVQRCTPENVAEAVQGLLGASAPVLRAPGIPEGWAPNAVPDTPALGARELDGYAAVVTAATVACAATGTIALDGSPDQGRRAISLVPDLHVCLVRADQVVPSVPDMLTRLQADRPITLISGPSATSDIELDRVEGVHGPRTLCVVLIDTT